MGSFRAFAQWEPITTFGGERAVDRFGAEIEPIGDVDDDGIPDYAVTAPGFDGAAGPESGKVYVVSGATGAWIHEIEGEQAFGLFGTAVVAVTDVNADGVPDLLISAPNFGNQPEDFHRGRAYVYSGADGSRMAVMDGEAPNDAFGTALVFIPGPTPLSGYAVVGAPAYDCRDGDGVVAQANCGRVYAFAASGLRTGAPSVWRARGHEADAAFGSSLTRAGLVDLDAVQDFAVGSPGFGGGLGRVTILSAAGGGRIRSFDGEQVGSGFGTVLAGGEDLTGDGAADLFIGAPSFDVEGHIGPGEVPVTLTDVGKVYVYDAVGGGLLATDGGRVRELSLLGQSSHFAGALRITRDLTGDGVADVLVGADGAAAFLGEVYVYAGASLGQPIHVVQEFIGPRAGQTGFGRSFADVGDLNGDGAVDLDDVAQAMQDAGVGAAVESDANMDGKTDGEDVLYVVDALGGETPWLVEDIAGELYSVMSQIEAEGGANAFLNTEACVGGNPEHRAAISDTWYVPGSDHQRSLSRLWPNNHFVSISVSWDDVDHSVATSHSDKWPADHEGVYSCTWSHAPDSGTDATCPDSEHSFAVSQAHPGEHEVARSDLWHNAPGHYYSRSQTWPTDIGEHEPAISRTWPGNHFYDISDGGGVSNHHEEYSYYDWPGDHDTHRSQNWPPSHEESVSISWAPGHSDPWSFRWPPNHTSFVSATWDPGSYPTQWPPNHVASFSEQQNQPGPWDETWPPDHSRWDSVREILDLTPPLLPDQWWPLP
ncbi:MAG: FG-GAP repeat protein [Myxococcales bacterium]|nr:FG-GAP repeat protein [Myxococcales bacterium]